MVVHFIATVGILWWSNKVTMRPNPQLYAKQFPKPTSSYFFKCHLSSSSAFEFQASSPNTMQLLARAKARPVLTSQICATPHLSWASAKTKETTWQFENSGVLWAILHNLEMCLATAHAIKMRGKSPKHSCKIVQKAFLWNAISAQSVSHAPCTPFMSVVFGFMLFLL